MDPSTDSLERLVPEALDADDSTGLDTLALHLARYEFAARFARSGARILDMACGVGYGTRLLADRSSGSALGVDLSEEAISHARRSYAREGVDFAVADALEFGEPAGYDLVVSLETVEHVDDPVRLMRRLLELVRPGGVLVASVPTTPSTDVNPHHQSDFTRASFRAMLRDTPAREIDQLFQVQRVPIGGVLMRSEKRMADMRPNLLAYYATHPGSLLRRLASTLRHGFANHYLTLAWRHEA
ncbi:MAG: SAM-dependent methyltransferase [Deltaproteobacteria bacterium]|jgi:SAM-dependent methyltransferase|nr:SAM-dependent methyltransferase [Deltaproteobacteria bacterium]